MAARDKTAYLRFRNNGCTDYELKQKISELFEDAKRRWDGVFSLDSKIMLSPSHLSVCVASLQNVKLFNSNLDVVDDAFEYLMSKSSKGEKGQYFTPRYVIDMCVKMMNPKESEYVIDTAAGSAGFTVHSIFHVWREIRRRKGLPAGDNFTAEERSNDEINYVQTKVFAIDFDEKAVRVARTLNLIAGDGQTNVLHLNTLDYSRWDEVTKQEIWNDTYNQGFKKLKALRPHGAKDFKEFSFDLLMANPPFAGDIKENQIISRYELGKNAAGKWQTKVGRDILFIERNLNFLKPGGRMAIVLPQGRFNNSSDKIIRDFIAERCRILAVVGLHGNTFKPHTGTKTSVLFVQKWDDELCPKVDDYNIFFATMQEPGKDNSGVKLLKKFYAKSIESIMISIQNFGAYSLCNNINFCETGRPFLMTQNIRHNYIDWNDLRYIDEDSHTLLKKSHCFSKQVLITMAGEYLGRVAVYDEPFISSSNQAIAKVTLQNGYNPYYISTFLNTRYGQNQINRFKTITGQPNINMGLIQSLEVIITSNLFASHIEDTVLLSERLRKTAKEAYQTAESMLLSHLGLENYIPNPDGMQVKSFSSSFGISGRLDSEYYQPKYEQILQALSIHKLERLGDIVDIKKSIEPGSNYYCNEGVPFVRVSNLSKYEISEPDIKIPFNTVNDIQNLYPKKDSILLSKDGSVGIAFKVEEDMTCVTSGAILHLVINHASEILPDYLTLVINSMVVQMQAERDAGGSIIQHWKPSEISNVLIPVLDISEQRIISTKIQESFSLRKKSVKLLEIAKTAVEVAIEQGEDKAIMLLEELYNGEL
ncbi:MAG: N-6 DNA methylase [Faecalispora sporosphaeroides]|uniref:N-6 DNA methylase n=1 Tax=Faecalispora sporosphaeroides TaxID=1549 RepID=UPI00399221CF